MKKTLVLLLIFYINGYSQFMDPGKARGLFMSIAIGPRIPISSFSNSQIMGIGFNVEISYTDNEFIPLFLYAKAGYEHYPGSIDFYRRTQYSSITTNAIPLNAGFRLFFPPILENIVLLIPIIEAGGSYLIIEKSHQFKMDSGRNNYLEDNSKVGFHIGGGFSMFLIELAGTYNYYPDYEYLSADVRLRIPIFIKL